MIQSHQPSFSERSGADLARSIFGIDGSTTPLPSERDQNFRLQAANGARFVLKISQAGEDRALLACQNEVMERLNAAGTRFRFPRIRHSLNQEAIVGVTGPEGDQHWLRLVEFVEGTPLALVRPHPPSLLREIGALLGTVDRVLHDYQNPATIRQLQWDGCTSAAVIAEHLGRLPDARRSRVKAVLSLLARAAPVLDQLRRSVIHNDGNDYNLIVRPPAPGAPLEPVQLVGLIDFGDLLQSWTLAEVAVAAAYVMLGKSDPMAAAAEVVAGYHAEWPIPEPEFEAIYPLVCSRLALSVTLSAAQRSARPDNEYLSISEAAAWSMLERLARVDPSYAHYRFRAACGLEPCPDNTRVVGWLRAYGHTAAAILPEHDLNNARVLDFSVQSLEFGEQAGAEDPNVWSKSISAALRAQRANIGMGRYDEVRPWYTAPAFHAESNGVPDWRTIHIGVDLFADPGTAVCTPFDGVVHSLYNSAGHLDYGPIIILRHEVADRTTFFTLYGHLSLESLEALRVGAAVRRGERIATLGSASVNGGWAPHLHFQIITDLIGHAGEFPGVARPSERALWLSLSPDPNLVLRLAQLAPAPRIDADALLQERHARIGPSLSIAYRHPLTIVRGWMQNLFDENGQPYLDAVNNVAHVGHCHPRVVDALRRQAAVLNTNTRYLHENLVDYAERLSATLPAPLSVCYLVCSGSEANELALRLARAHTRRHARGHGPGDVIVVDGAYHGNTSALIELSPYKFNGPGGTGCAEHVQVVPLPDPYRGAYRGQQSDVGLRYAHHVRAAVEHVHARSRHVAAFFAEPLLGCGGQIVLPDGYLEAAFAHVRAAGGLCVVDEVQTGLGRVGSHFWAFQTQNVVPDIVTVGKPIGNGHPLGAVFTTPEIAASFANGMEYFNTFGGNPVSCAVGTAVLDVIAEERLQHNALRVGAIMLNGLRELQSRHALLGDVRGLGFYLGVELVLDRERRTPAGACAAYVANRMRQRGILLSTDGPDHNVLKIKPPLVFTEADAHRLVETLDSVLYENAIRING
ncbi:MAG: aminotransferase class III-fold pyridoxal phosphate-dependent enzyme [Longimicrobiales bacterium]